MCSTKQRAAIQKLEEDNAALREELMLENKFSVRPTSAHAAALIAILQDECDGHTRKIEVERAKVADFNERAAQLAETVERQRKEMGGLHAAAEEESHALKQLRIAENRLEKQYHKVNAMQCRTQDVRGEVDNLRRERLVFDDILSKLQRSLGGKRSEMANLLRGLHQVSVAKEKAQAEMANIKVKADRDHAANEAEWKQLTELLENSQRERQAKREAEMVERERNTAALLKAEARTRNRGNKEQWSSNRNNLAQNQAVERSSQLEAAFSKILAATGEKDIPSLVRRLRGADDSNFGLFNYVNEVNAEVDTLEEQIAAIMAEVELYRRQASSQDAAQRAAILEEEEKVAKAENRAATAELRLITATRRCTELCTNLSTVFDSAGCNTEGVRHLLGDAPVCEANLMQHLGVLEQRANEIVQDYISSAAPDENAALEKVAALLGGGADALNRVAKGGPLPSDLPSIQALDDPDDGIAADDDDRPLDRSALEAKVRKNLARKADGVTRQKAAAAGLAAIAGLRK
eukprot:jgi/Botrbrau1/15836/Bobra.40_1s0020.2